MEIKKIPYFKLSVPCRLNIGTVSVCCSVFNKYNNIVYTVTDINIFKQMDPPGKMIYRTRSPMKPLILQRRAYILIIIIMLLVPGDLSRTVGR